MKLKENLSLRRLIRYVILAAIIVTLALISWTVYLMLKIKPATNTANRFIDNIKSKNTEAALALTTEDFQKSFSKSNIEQAVNAPVVAEVLKQGYDLKTKKIITKSPLTVNLVYAFDHSGNKYEISIIVIKQDNQFKIDKASIDSSALKQQFFGQ